MRHVFPWPPIARGLACAALLAALAVSQAGVATAQDGAPEAPAAVPQPAAATIAVGEKVPAGLILLGKAGGAEGVPRARVYVFWSPRCPVCRRYAASLRALADDFSTKATVALVASADETAEAIGQALAAQELRLPVVRDPEGRAARRLGLRVSPTAVLVDAGGVLRYRGPIDDDRRARQRDAREHLRPALEAVLTGKPVEASEVRPFGSALRR